MKGTLLAASAVAVMLLGGCSKAEDAAKPGSGTLALTAPSSAPAAPAAACAHAACADNFYVDAVPADGCAAGSPCTLAVKLVATGDFHINDEYPYRFKADDAPGVEFLGTDAAGKGSFTKGAGDWKKTEEKSGTMTVKFTPAASGPKAVSGTFKLSVCSAANCLLEQRPVSATIVAK